MQRPTSNRQRLSAQLRQQLAENAALEKRLAASEGKVARLSRRLAASEPRAVAFKERFEASETENVALNGSTLLSSAIEFAWQPGDRISTNRNVTKSLLVLG